MWTRRNTFRVIFLICILVIPLALNWTKDGIAPDKAFWIFLDYFVEIAIWGVIEVGGAMLRRSKGEA